MFTRKFKAAGVAILGIRKGVQFNKKKGRAFFLGLGPRIAAVAAFFGYDVRYKPSGQIWFQLKDRKRERKIVKRLMRYYGEKA